MTNRKVLLILLAVLFIVSLPLNAFAENAAESQAEYVQTLSINDAEEFLAFAQNCRLDSYSRALYVELCADIDLSSSDFAGIPTFSGTFDGGGHTISGVNITAYGSVQGFFRYLEEEAVVQHLNVKGTVAPQGSRSTVGGIAGSNRGRIEDCHFEGSVSGAQNTGGIAGANAVSAIIDLCTARGEVHGDHMVGGIAGENSGVVRACANYAKVNNTPQQNSVELSDITIDSITNAESVNTVTDIGGIAGQSSGVIRQCENRGDVGYKHMGYNVGGIAGSQAGYVVSSSNYANVSGRKEVGGIVGQLEPAAKIEYSEDTLQILDGQLDTLSVLTNRASSNAQSGAADITGQVSAIGDQTEKAIDALSQLVPEEGELPDADSITAAQNTLSGSMSKINSSMNSIAASAQSTAAQLTKDLQAVSAQIGAVQSTIGNASENLGANISDVSDEDTSADTSAKVEGCTNYAKVLADLNAGGIVGSVAMENDLDPENDVTFGGEQSLNADVSLRAVVLECENRATVSVRKQNGGGIVGFASMGLVRDCANAGTLDGETADYIGGIAGQSSGFIRACVSKCVLYADSIAGGISGSAKTVSDCHSMVDIAAGKEKLGAVLGFCEDRTNITGNYYISIAEDIGAIDSVSYEGCAQQLEGEVSEQIASLPELFRTVSVTFNFEDGTAEVITLNSGERLDADDLPEIPQKEGWTGVWEGADEQMLECITFDLSFDVLYRRISQTIASEQQTEEGQPVLLAVGNFAIDSSLVLERSGDEPMLGERQTAVQCWDYSINSSAGEASFRWHLPKEYAPSRMSVMVHDGVQWGEAESSLDGSSIVFGAAAQQGRICLVYTEPDYALIMYAAAGGVTVIAIIVLALLIGKKIRRKRKAAENAADGQLVAEE